MSVEDQKDTELPDLAPDPWIRFDMWAERAREHAEAGRRHGDAGRVRRQRTDPGIKGARVGR